MKVELQKLSETYEEEKLIVQTPQPTDKVQKVIEFAENLDRTEKIKGKSIIRSISLRLARFSASISRIGRFWQKRQVRPTPLIYDSIRFLKFCQQLLSKFPNQKSSISTPSLTSSSPPTVW